MNKNILLIPLLLLAGCNSSSNGALDQSNNGTPCSFKEKKIRILMCVNDHNITESLVATIKAGIGHKYNLQIEEIPYADKLLEHAQNESIDVFILVFNNMLIPGAICPPEIRLKKALNVLSYIKEKFKKPVIAMAGWPGDPVFEEEAKSAGANYFFRLPFAVRVFQEAVGQCIIS
jgi:hypothetical protein